MNEAQLLDWFGKNKGHQLSVWMDVGNGSIDYVFLTAEELVRLVKLIIKNEQGENNV